MITHPRYQYPVWKSYAVLLPNGEPLMCKHGKIVYATKETAGGAVQAMECEFSRRMRAYLCTEQPPHYHLATGGSGADRRKRRRAAVARARLAEEDGM